MCSSMIAQTWRLPGPCPEACGHLQAEIKSQIHEMVERLEAMNTQPTPLEDPSCVAGEWRVLYSTIKITV